MAITEEINPRILLWARETAGFTVDQAAEKLGLTSSARSSAADKLRAFEAGEKAPTQQQLHHFAGVYRRPLIAFYLPEPPNRGDRGEDFRTTGAAVSVRDNAILDTLLRDLRARQQLVRNLLEDEDEAAPLPFIGSARIDHGAVRVAAALRNVLGVTHLAQRQAADAQALFALLRTAAERAGVYVLLLGDVGSHHSDIGEEVFRGIAIADEIAPFVVINDNDAKTARSFTLVHELAHLWIGASGVSGPLQGFTSDGAERFCNDVAGEFLMPQAALEDYASLRRAEFAAVLQATERVAKDWKVSQALVTYRFVRCGWITDDVAGRLFGYFSERWRKEKQRAKESRDPDLAGPSFYVVRRHRLGAALLAAVRRGLQGELLTHTRAAKILGVSPARVGPLLQERIQA